MNARKIIWLLAAVLFFAGCRREAKTVSTGTVIGMEPVTTAAAPSETGAAEAVRPPASQPSGEMPSADPGTAVPIAFETRTGTGLLMAPYAEKILFSGTYTYAAVGEHAYHLDRAVTAEEQLWLILDEERLLSRIGYEGVLNIFVTADTATFADADSASVYLNRADAGTWKQILAVLGAFHGDYTNYGFLYAEACRLAEELGWETDDAGAEAAASAKDVFAACPELLNLEAPCFDGRFCTEEQIGACRWLAREMAAETPEAMRENVLGWAQEHGIGFQPSGLHFAYYGEDCPLKLDLGFMQVYFEKSYWYSGNDSSSYRLGTPARLKDIQGLFGCFDVMKGVLSDMASRFPEGVSPARTVFAGPARYARKLGGEAPYGIIYGEGMIVVTALEYLPFAYTWWLGYETGSPVFGSTGEWVSQAAAMYYGSLYAAVFTDRYAGNAGAAPDPESVFDAWHNVAYEELAVKGKQPKNVVNILGCGASFADYVTATYGEEAFIGLYRHQEDCAALTGRTLEQLLEDWALWIAQRG